VRECGARRFAWASGCQGEGLKHKTLIFLPFLFVILGCASGAKITSAKAATDNVALLYVFRPSCAPISLEPTVYINEVDIGDLYDKGYFYIELKPGKYNVNIVWSLISGVRPQLTVIDIMAEPGKVYYVRVFTQIKMANFGYSPLYVSENDTDISDESKSMPIIKDCKLLEKRPGVENRIVPK
jgi:hypothetical protein